MLLYSTHLLFPHISAIVSSSGIVTYSEVKTFLKKKPDMVLGFKSISFWNETLTLTGNYLLYAKENSVDKFHPMQVCFYHLELQTIIFRNILTIPILTF